MRESERPIHLYDASLDAASTFALWQHTVGPQWPLDFARFQAILAAPGTRHFVIREQGEVLAFVGTQHHQHRGIETGHLLLLLVAPAWQRRGLGTALYERALHHLREAGVQVLHLGGLSPRFWCGVPDNLASCLPFFTAHEWTHFTLVYDLTRDLSQYSTPPVIYQRIVEEQISLEPGRQDDMVEVLAFEQREYPNWLHHFETSALLGDYQDVLIAREHNGAIVGTLNMRSPRAHPARPELLWPGLLGENVGGLGAVGVAPSAQGRGIGIALVARASDLLKERGAGTCYIDWVELTQFYAKLGYTPWRAYHTSWRELST